MKPLFNRIYTLAERVVFVQRGRVQGYLLATCVVAFALWLRLFIAPAESGLPFLTFFPAVTLVALLGGVGAGLYALILCCFLASYLFIPPFQALNFAFTKELIFTNLVFACEEFLVILVIEALYRQRSRSLITTQQLNDVSLIKQELDILAAAFDGDDGVIITDAHGHIQRVNRAFTEATGYSADEIKGHTPQILQSGDHDAQFYRAMWDTIRREGAWRGETWSRRKDGTSIPNWLTITAIKNSDGQLTHYVGTQVDISQRLSIEAQLLASEKRYRTLFESAVDAIFIAHPYSGLILDCNTSACQLMQKPKNQLVGMHQTKLHPADQAEQYQRVFQEHIKTGREIVEDVFVVLENGAAIPVDIHAVVIELEGEAVILGLFRNITQRKLLEDQLAATAAEFEALYDNAPCGYHSIDANGYFTRINKLALAWFECERHEIIGKLRPVDFLPPRAKSFLNNLFRALSAKGKLTIWSLN